MIVSIASLAGPKTQFLQFPSETGCNQKYAPGLEQ
jgi:hypothetical protein